MPVDVAYEGRQAEGMRGDSWAKGREEVSTSGRFLRGNRAGELSEWVEKTVW
jgi:hypothetical protein